MIDAIINAVRALPGFWIEHFEFDPRNNVWLFGGYKIPADHMPSIAKKLGGWPRDYAVSPVYHVVAA